MKNIAVVGCGYWGKNLVRNFWELGSLYAICDTDQNRLREFKTKYPGLKAYSSFKKVLEDKDVLAVAIATLATSHCSMAKEALLNDKDVFVEKPLALELKEAEEVVKLSKERQKVFMVGHIFQYNRAVIKLKELIDSGELGKIQYIYSNRLNIGKIRTEENILWSFAPHDISIILRLLNEFPESVSAKGANYLQKSVSDVTLTTMDFASGAKAHIFVSWLHPFKDQKLVVVGDKKMALFDDLSKEKLFLYPHRINWVNRMPVACKANAEVIPIEMEEPLRLECQHFLECIQNRSIPITNGEEGLRILKILDAFQQSLNKNGETISLEKRERPYFIHPSCYVDDGVKIGEGSKIWYFSHILKDSNIGKNCIVGQNVMIGPDVKIGDGCKIQNNVSIYKAVTLEDSVFCGPSCVFTNVINPRAFIERKDEFRKTLVKEGATIGANATVVCGYTIGRFAFIGAGAVVTRDIPDFALVVGNPARIVGWMCECGIKLEFEKLNGNAKAIAICKTCNKMYIKEENLVRMMLKQEDLQYADSL